MSKKRENVEVSIMSCTEHRHTSLRIIILEQRLRKYKLDDLERYLTTKELEILRIRMDRHESARKREV